MQSKRNKTSKIKRNANILAKKFVGKNMTLLKNQINFCDFERSDNNLFYTDFDYRSSSNKY